MSHRFSTLIALLALALASCGDWTTSANPPCGAGSDCSPVNASGAASTGGSGNGGNGGNGGSGGSMCTTPIAPVSPPTWLPPHAIELGVCSSAQLQQEYDLCEHGSPLFDQAACGDFDASIVNRDCLSCLLSTGGTESAAIMVYGDGGWVANIGGCIALVDGDTTSTGCGARTQSAATCSQTACSAACVNPTSSDWATCQQQALDGACKPYLDAAAACRDLPTNAVCNTSPDFRSSFLGLGEIFCGSGLGGSASGAAN